MHGPQARRRRRLSPVSVRLVLPLGRRWVLCVLVLVMQLFLLLLLVLQRAQLLLLLLWLWLLTWCVRGGWQLRGRGHAGVREYGRVSSWCC